MSRPVILETELRSQKRTLTAHANAARVCIKNARHIIEVVNTGSDDLTSLKEQVQDAHQNVREALDVLGSVDQWIQREISRDQYVSADPDLTDMYTTMLKAACEERQFTKLCAELEEVLEEIGQLIDSKSPPGEKFLLKEPPTPEDYSESDEEYDVQTTQSYQHSPSHNSARKIVPIQSNQETPILRQSKPRVQQAPAQPLELGTNKQVQMVEIPTEEYKLLLETARSVNAVTQKLADQEETNLWFKKQLDMVAEMNKYFEKMTIPKSQNQNKDFKTDPPQKTDPNGPKNMHPSHKPNDQKTVIQTNSRYNSELESGTETDTSLYKMVKNADGKTFYVPYVKSTRSNKTTSASEYDSLSCSDYDPRVKVNHKVLVHKSHKKTKDKTIKSESEYDTDETVKYRPLLKLNPKANKENWSYH